MNDDVILVFPGGVEGNVSCLYVVVKLLRMSL